MFLVRPQDVLIVALLDNNILYGGCLFNYLELGDGNGMEQQLEEIRASILIKLFTQKSLSAQKNILLYPNPGLSSTTISIPLAGRLLCKI